MKPAYLISNREFARRLGVSEGAVRKAIEVGHIVKGVESGPGYKGINPDVAKQEWADSVEGGRPRSDKLVNALFDAPPIGGERSATAKAKEAKAVYEAKRLKLSYEKESGKLVEKRLVDMEIFAAGRYIRDRVQELPDTAIDDVLAVAEDRHAARLALKRHVDKLLHEIAKRLEKYDTH